MTRRHRGRADRQARFPRPGGETTDPSRTPPGRRRVGGDARTATSPIVATALVPLRVFLGGTFLYAGLDKIWSPSFFAPSGAGSIHDQLALFARTSPLAPLLHAVLPIAGVVGLVIALAELAVGLGALSGYGFRVAAAGGLALAVLFWLTASWATTPYYFGPDLPYAAGWLTLALAGHGDVLVPRRWLEPTSDAGRRAARSLGPAISRRALLEAGVLAAGAAVLASVAVPLRWMGVATGPATGDATPTPEPSSTPAPTTPAGMAVGSAAGLTSAGAVAFTVPFDAPLPLPAGDPAFAVRLRNGTLAGFDAICTHAGCPVEWDQADALLVCPCHGAAFDPNQGGAAIAGPTRQPLEALAVAEDPATGTLILITSA